MSRRAVVRSLLGVLFVGTAALGALLAYELGGRVGFEEGLLAGQLRDDGIDAAFAVRALRSIRRGDPEAAIGILEGSVDGALLTYWGLSQLDLSRFDRKDRLRDVHLSYARGAARYRSEFPSPHPDEGVRNTIAETVASLAAYPDADCPEPSSSISEPSAILAPERTAGARGVGASLLDAAR